MKYVSCKYIMSVKVVYTLQSQEIGVRYGVVSATLPRECYHSLSEHCCTWPIML